MYINNKNKNKKLPKKSLNSRKRRWRKSHLILKFNRREKLFQKNQKSFSSKRINKKRNNNNFRVFPKVFNAYLIKSLKLIMIFLAICFQKILNNNNKNNNNSSNNNNFIKAHFFN